MCALMYHEILQSSPGPLVTYDTGAGFPDLGVLLLSIPALQAYDRKQLDAEGKKEGRLEEFNIRQKTTPPGGAVINVLVDRIGAPPGQIDVRLEFMGAGPDPGTAYRNSLMRVSTTRLVRTAETRQILVWVRDDSPPPRT